MSTSTNEGSKAAPEKSMSKWPTDASRSTARKDWPLPPDLDHEVYEVWIPRLQAELTRERLAHYGMK